MGVTASAESSVDCLSMEQLSVCSTSSTFDFRHLVQFICSFLHCPLLPSSRGTKPQADSASVKHFIHNVFILQLYSEHMAKVLNGIDGGVMMAGLFTV